MKDLLAAFVAGLVAAHVIRLWIRAEVRVIAGDTPQAPLPRMATNISKL